MSELTLAVAQKIVADVLAHSRSHNFNPMGVVVLDDRGALKAAAMEDGSSLIRWKIAFGKAYGAVSWGAGSRKVACDRRRPAAFPGGGLPSRRWRHPAGRRRRSHPRRRAKRSSARSVFRAIHPTMTNRQPSRRSMPRACWPTVADPFAGRGTFESRMRYARSTRRLQHERSRFNGLSLSRPSRQLRQRGQGEPMMQRTDLPTAPARRRDSSCTLDLPLGETAFFFDVDGTLLEIVAEPADVVADPALRDLMTRLIARTDAAVALVSGRTLADLDRIFAPLAIAGGGSPWRRNPLSRRVACRGPRQADGSCAVAGLPFRRRKSRADARRQGRDARRAFPAPPGSGRRGAGLSERSRRRRRRRRARGQARRRIEAGAIRQGRGDRRLDGTPAVQGEKAGFLRRRPDRRERFCIRR